MNIAICDNEEMFVKNISGLLEEYLNENKLQYSIDMYSSGSELIGLKDKIVNYDIVFLDINMTGIDNIKVAEWIRMYSDRVIIISITTMSDYNMKGYKYDVFRYLLKDSMDLKGSIQVAGGSDLFGFLQRRGCSTALKAWDLCYVSAIQLRDHCVVIDN